MSTDPFWRQDNGGPLGIFKDGRLIQLVPDGIKDAYAFRDRLALRHRVPDGSYEVLKSCAEHPDVSAVDCLDCDWSRRRGTTHDQDA